MWIYNGKEFTEEMVQAWVGFVYIIHIPSLQMNYVGRKLFTKSKTIQKNKKKKKTRVSSDWQNYCGSNEKLLEYVKLHGQEGLQKTILHLCKSKSWLSYMETKEIINRDAIIREDFFNSWFSCRIRKEHLK